MYLAHYGLKKKPFDISPDPRFLWLGEKHREALSYLKYGILENKGFLMITGDVGTGKTALIKRLTRLIDAATFVVTVPDPDMTKLDFFNFLADELNMNRTFQSKGEFLIQFKHFLKDAYSEHRKVLLIIDESQRLNHELLQEIRLLANIDLGGQVLLNIFFVGQTEFHQILKEERNRTVRQRITASFHLDPLNAGEVKNYIVHRLRVAGATSQIFTDEAIQRIFGITSGYPRLINILCDHALMTGYSSGTTAILPSIIDECAGDLSITFGHRMAPADVRNKLEPEPIPAAEIDPALFDAPASVPDDMSGVSTEEVVKQMAQAAKESKRAFLRPLALATAVLLMLVGITYFTFGPVRDYVADSIQAESEPPPLNTFASDDVKTPKNSLAPETVANQDALAATTEVPTAYKTAGDDEAVVVKTTLESVETRTQPPDQDSQANQPTETVSDNLQAGVQQGPENTPPSQTGGDISTKEKAAPENEATSAVGSEAISPLAAREGKKPVMIAEARQVIIFFEHDSHFLPAEAAAKLSRMVGAAFRSPDAMISIMGYTDSLGNEWYNRKLSQTRANIVRDFFVKRGIQPEKIKAVGKGAVNPLASNDTADGRRKNRRVEIFIGSAVN